MKLLPQLLLSYVGSKQHVWARVPVLVFNDSCFCSQLIMKQQKVHSGPIGMSDGQGTEQYLILITEPSPNASFSANLPLLSGPSWNLG